MATHPSIPRDRDFGLPLTGDPGLALLLHAGQSLEIEVLERMLLAYAVHPDGLGFERAHLLLHDATAEELVAWEGVAADRNPCALTDAMARAAIVVRSGRGAPRRVRWPITSLDGLAHLAWEGDPVVLHAEATAGAEGAVRLEGHDHRHGLLVGGWEDARDADVRRERLERFHAALRIAFAACDARAERRRTQARLEAVATAARAAVSSLNVAEVLHQVAETVARDGATIGATVWSASGSGMLRLQVSYGDDDRKEGAARALAPLATSAWSAQRAQWVEHPADEPLLPTRWAQDLVWAAALPLVAYGRSFGALLVHARRGERPAAHAAPDRATRAYLLALADQVALACDQAERAGELERAAERAHDLDHRLRRIEPAAEYGAGVSDRARSLGAPVASILAFARRALAGLAEDDPNREYLEIVRREAERLEAQLAGFSAPPDPGIPALERVQPNELVQGAVQQLAERLVRRRVRLVKKLSPEVPVLLIDAPRVREALASLLGNAVESVAVGGRIRVESKRLGGHVLIEVAHDGVRGAGSTLEQLFVPFEGRSFAATDLGAAERIVRQHGGEVRARSEGEWSAIVAFTLPIQENQDRRAVAERRRVGQDRRRRFPEPPVD